MALQSFDNFTNNISDAPSSTGPTSYLSNVIITFCIVIFFIFSFIGNLVTLVTIKSNSHLQNISNSFIASLCLSDLISTVLCSPLWLYRRTWGYSDWRWSNFLCKFYWVSDFTTNYVTALHIASFAAFRFAAVYKPYKIWDVSKIKILSFIILLWIFSLIIAMPLFMFMAVRDITKNKAEKVGGSWPSCSIVNEQDCCAEQFHVYTITVYPAVFLLPLIFIVVCSVLLIKKLIEQNKKFSNVKIRKTSENVSSCSTQMKKKLPPVSDSSAILSSNVEVAPKKAVLKLPLSENVLNIKTKNKKQVAMNRQKKTFLQLGLVVFSFMLGYIPTAVYLIWTTSTSGQPLLDYWFGIGSYLCLRFSECLNPVMYNLGSNKLRLATRKLLQKITGKLSQKKEVSSSFRKSTAT